MGQLQTDFNLHTKNLIRAFCILICLGTYQNQTLHAQTQTTENLESSLDPILRSQTEVVSFEVSVVNKNGESISGLKSENFVVYENNVKQEIRFFSISDRPVSIAIVFDMSGSMKSRLAQTVKTIDAFLSYCQPGDEYCVVGIGGGNSEVPVLLQDFRSVRDTDTAGLKNSESLRSGGRTALFDGIQFAAQKVAQSSFNRRAIFLFSDGQDNYSRTSLNEIKKILFEQNIQFYSIAMNDKTIDTILNDPIESAGLFIMDELAQVTGGSAFFPRTTNQIDLAARLVAIRLKSQYSIGYYSELKTNTNHKKNWQKLKIKIKKPGTQCVVLVKKGYFR